MDRQDKLDILQEEERKLLFSFVDICEQENYKYFLVEGSMLGAIRHNDIIPWDDDIDVGMPRKDYDLFVQKYGDKLINNKYKLSYFYNTENCNRVFAQLRSDKVTVKFNHVMKPYCSKAWIDIFPLDGVPIGKIEFLLYKMQWRLLRYIFVMSNFDTSANIVRSGRPIYERLMINFCKKVPFWKLINKRKAYDRYHRFLRKYPYDDMPKIINAISAYKDKAIFDKKIFADGKSYVFHGRSVMGPSDAHNYCKSLYGDYMTPPPEDKRNWHESEIYLDDGELFK